MSAETQVAPSAGARPARNRKTVEARRQELLAIGRELFSGQSYDEIRIEAVAEAAGISKGLLYHYFPSKRDFYVAALRVAADELWLRLQLPESDDPVGDLHGSLEAYLGYVEEHAGEYVALFRGGIGFDASVIRVVDDVRQRILSRILDRLPGCPGPRERALWRGFIGFVEASVLDWLEHRELPREELVGLWSSVAQTLTTSEGVTSA